ncbi:MAG TPA: alcohol dehydrogenase catalytic domain-containing protein [Anaerolineaceae bacterium]|nr:alcohol dehydrogenase catalytic domain-containing protein [Anaerolineaceae bacterium]
MKAIVFYNVGDIRFEPNWPEPRPLKPDEVRIATDWCGICGTDMEDYKTGAIIPVGKPHPVSGRMAPMVIGHEYSGRVMELGSEVKGLKIGQRVAIECLRVCGHCFWCKRGEYAACLNQVSIGQVDDGGMADCFNVPAMNCIPIPDSLPADAAALAEPLAVMVRGVQKGRVQVGDIVTIIGAGAIGLCGIAAARLAGASQVIALTHGGNRAEAARQMGASTVLDTREDYWKEAFYDLTHGLGSDVVIEACANLAGMREAVELTRRQGRCVFSSVINADVSLNAFDIMFKEKEIIGTDAHQADREFLWAVQFLADGRIDVKPIITSRIYIADAVEMGFNRLLTDRSQIKILVTPHKDLVK